jgi:hypothetical protein
MMHLTLQLERCAIKTGHRATWSAQHFENACALADIFAELRIADDLEVLMCSALLRDAVARLMNVFCMSPISLETHFDLNDICLPAYKRRALILSAATLIMQVLSCASDGNCQPTVNISLSTTASQRTRLVVAAEGLVPLEHETREADDIVDELADLLEVGNVRRLHWIGGFITQIEFPGV